MYRWLKPAVREARAPSFTFVCDQSFRMESVETHDPEVPMIGLTAQQWPGHRLQEQLPRFLMHLIANAAQIAVGRRFPVDCRYPIKLNGIWYRSHAQISVPEDGSKQFIFKIRREPLVIGYQEAMRSAINWLGPLLALWAV